MDVYCCLDLPEFQTPTKRPYRTCMLVDLGSRITLDEILLINLYEMQRNTVFQFILMIEIVRLSFMELTRELQSFDNRLRFLLQYDTRTNYHRFTLLKPMSLKEVG